VAALLLAVSPTVLFMGATLLSHPTALLFLIWFCWFALRTVRMDSLLNPVLAGVCYSAAFHVRSATVLLVVTPIVLLLLIALLRKFRANFLKTVVLGLVTCAGVGFYLWLNYHVNGDPFKTNYHAAWLGVTKYDSPFGFNKGAWTIIHTPQRGFANMINNLIRLNFWYLGWPLGLGFLALWFFKRQKRWVELAAVVAIFATYIFYFFYFWPGISDTGPVLYFELVLPLTVLAVPSLFWLRDFLGTKFGVDTATKRIVLFTAFSILIAFGTFHYFELKNLALAAENVKAPYEEMDSRGVDNAVVFMDYYVKGDNQDSWVAGRKNTHIELGDNVLYVLNFGAEKDKEYLKKYHPLMQGWVFWYERGKPYLVKLEDYQINNVLKNYPESR